MDTESIAADFYERQVSDESVTYVGRPEAVELAAGRAHLVPYARPAEEAVFYAGAGADASFTVICSGPVRPADDWRSVIEGFEWLPLAVQRVRAPRTGVSFEVPATWSVNESDWLPDSTLSSSSGARFADWVMAHEVPAGQSCSISVYATDPGSDVSLDAEVAGVLADYQSESSVEVLAPEAEPIRLPAGDAIRVRTIVDYDQSPDAPYAVVHEVRYFLARGPDAYLIRCSGPTPLPDRWQSIAETFELLSEE